MAFNQIKGKGKGQRQKQKRASLMAIKDQGAKAMGQSQVDNFFFNIFKYILIYFI